ncbi:uncharacterized protein LOC116066065 isoform X2 [Sander lucioperca]|uniref:uncharacterized protein LOC116066065 isoform X2 n=1 Tax=Sander lucioperca TaxID=283035 RepID=UPI001653E18C|nr:uncharacterized protein LOC116066065 isoform X2 [Sander lucioperca]
MDANKVWQWRIMHAKTFLRCPDSFYHSNRIGLDFNVASKTHKKKELQLLTNGVVLEICDFAKTVSKNKMLFITNILENNFDLGLENEQQRVYFSNQIKIKVQDPKRLSLQDKNEVFTLFDISSKPECNSNNGLNMASTERKTESFLVEIDDSEYEDTFKCSQATSKEYMKTENLSEEVNGAHIDDSEREDELKYSGAPSAEKLKEDVLLPLFPYCEEIGLNLDIGSKQSLDVGLLTNGVMLELLQVTKILAGSFSRIISDVLGHNFDLDLKSSQERTRVMNKILYILNKKQQLMIIGKVSPEFNNKTISLQTKRRQSDLKSKQEKRALLKTSERANKKSRRGQSKDLKKNGPYRHTDLCNSHTAKGDNFYSHPLTESDVDYYTGNERDMEQEEMETENNYTCPLGESDLDSDEVTDSGNTGNQIDLQSTKSCSLSSDIPRELNSSCPGICAPTLTTIDISSTLSTVNSNVNPPFVSQPDERELHGDEEQAQTPRKSPKKCNMEQEKMGTENNYTCPLGKSDLDSDTGNEFDMEQEKMETEKNMWKLRANRVKQILSSLEFGPFNGSKRFGLEFNVGFGPKQNFSVDSLPNSVLLEVAKFALAMNSSQQNFIMEILEYNFDISLQSEYQRNLFTCEIMKRIRQLKNSEDAVKFSKDIFELPDSMSSIKMANTSVGSVNPELGYNISRVEKCDVAPRCPAHSHAETKDHIPRNSGEVYPICKEMGLKLHVNKHQPNKKLDVSKLTNGAMTEVTNFVETLCGTCEQICLDILRHNLHLDLQSGDSDLARSIVARIPAIVEQRNLMTSVKTLKKIKGSRKDSSTKVKLDCQSYQHVDACSAGSSQAEFKDQDVGNSPDTKHQDELNLKLWKLRANHIQQILSTPHEEHCPLYSYSRCKKLGIDFNVGSGVKQNLDPKLLTNGIMVELNTFATALRSAQKHFITEILEYNFHLDFKNKLYRNAFAQQTLEKVKVDAHKRIGVPRMKMLFELPDMRYLQKLTCEKTTYCPKCFQDRNQELRQDESDPGHMNQPRPHTITDSVTADTDCTAQKPSKDPSSNFSAIEETIMDSYPCCKKIGLKLCVDKDQPKEKLDAHVLTRGAMIDVASFAKRLCATKSGIIHAVLEHNFNLGMQRRDVDIAQQFFRATALKDGGLAWFNEVFVIQSFSHRQTGRGSTGKLKQAAALRRSEWKEKIKKRKLALQTKMKRATLSSHNINDVKSNSNRQNKGNRFPIYTEMGLDLDVTSKPGEREILDLKLLTRGVCDMEQEEMETENNYTCPLGESDLDSDEVTDSGNTGNQIDLQSTKSCSLSLDISRESNSSCPGICAPTLTTADISSSLSTVNSNVNPPFVSQPDERGLRGGEEQTQTPRKSPNECETEQEKMGTENNYTCPLGESDLDSDTGNEFDMEQEKMETEKNMWKLRANRVKQILSSLEFGPFTRSKKVGLEFNVGFGPKQNFSVDCFPNSVLLEVAKFALAMNSSQQNFIMEILEYNFDITLQSEYQRNLFTCEIMNRIRQLKNSEDAVKFSKDIFEFPGRMQLINMENRRIKECDVAPRCPAHLHTETKDHIPTNSGEVYPICKEMGLKLHVNKHQPNKKLDVSKLTNGAMTEVTNFAETLCGTFDQICLDILRHNLDLDLQSGDSDLARSIVARIPAIVEQRNLLISIKTLKKFKGPRKDSSTKVKLDCQSYQHVDACSAGSSQAEFKDQDVGNSPDTKPQNELNLKLWKVRANHIQQILSTPHEEHCPLYSYSRCKKLGIDFNVGSGVKQNLDPKLLTNGIMVELNTFATALLSAQKHFITEILEYNFHLEFKNKLYRNAFAQQTLEKVKVVAHKKNSVPRMKMLFELPDMRYLQKPIYVRSTYCPKCFQDRNQELRQDESDPGHMNQPRPHTMTDSVTADANCTAQKPSKDPSNFSAIEETIMDSYPCCKKIGLKLCVDKDQPKEKLDAHVLTRGAMIEVARFARILCASKSRIIHTVLEHNFNLGMQISNVDIAPLFNKATALTDGGLAWFNEAFVIQLCPRRQPGHISKLKQAAALHRSEWKEAIKKRKLALQTKMKRATLPSHNTSVVKRSKTNTQSQIPVNCYPICTEIGLDLDVLSKSGEKEKLDLKLLTMAAVNEIHTFATKKTRHYLPNTLYEILDYNFDLSSQHHRRWKFSIETSSKIQTMVKQHRKNPNRPDEVFKLPFVFASSPRFAENRLTEKRNKYSWEEPYKKKTEGRFVRQVRYHSGVNRIHFLDGVKTNSGALFQDPIYPGTIEQMNGNLGSGGPLHRILQIKEEEYDPHHGNVKPEPDTEEKYCPHSDDVKTDPGTIVQMNGSLVSVGCGSPLQRNLQIKEEEYDPHHGNVKPEPDTEEKYCPRYDDVKTESNAEDVEHLVPGEPTGPLAYTLLTLWPNSESQKTVSENENVSQIKTEWDTEGVKYLVPVEAVGSQEYSMVTIGQGNESTLIIEEQKYVPTDSHHYGVHRK